MNIQSIIDLILNVINFIYNYIDKYVINLLVQLVKKPLDLIMNQTKFKTKLINNYYNTILSSIKYDESSVQILNTSMKNFNISTDTLSKPSIILQNHLVPKNDILASMYLMYNYLPNTSTFLGAIFSSFNNKIVNYVANNIIKSIVKEVSMIYIDWDLEKNKPAKEQLARIEKEAKALYDNDCNLLIYPEGKPTFNNLDLQTFKSGYKHIILSTEYENIVLVSVIYLDDDNKLLLSKPLIEAQKYQTKIMVENINIDRQKLNDEYLNDLDQILYNKMNHNLNQLVKAFVNPG